MGSAPCPAAPERRTQQAPGGCGPNPSSRESSPSFPGLDADTIDLVFETELPGFKARPLTVADMAREISFVKRSGLRLPGLGSLDPRALVVP